MFARIKWALDPYILALLGSIGLASVLPARGVAAEAGGWLTAVGIVILFFLHGARLSREAILAGAGNWRLHGAVLAATFVLFPLLGLVIAAIPGLPPMVATGLLLLTLLPSTIQSSIAFTSIAGGNVAAAVCSASFSNLLGIFLTPLLAAMLMSGQGAGISWDAAEKIALQLLVPFVAGHLLRPVIGGWVARHRKLVSYVDRGSILLVIYTAFSAAVVEGLWQQVAPGVVVVMVLVSAVLLALVLAITWGAGKAIGLSRADALVLLFCGSKKSLATGVPIARVLFPAAQVGAVILPCIVFHQIQLIACAVIARHFAQSLTRAPAAG